MSGPTDDRPPDDAPAPAGIAGPDEQLLALIQSHQRRGWRRGERPSVEAYLEQYRAMRADAELTLDLIYSEIVLREETGESPQLEEYLPRFPHLESRLRRQFEVDRALGSGRLSRVDQVIPWLGPTPRRPRL
jgi:hypothetical protein